MMLGGSAAEGKAVFGKNALKIPASKVPGAVKKLLELYREKRAGESEGLEAFINRTGVEAITAALAEFTVLQNYAANPKAFMDWGDGEEFHLKVGKGECAG